MSTEQKGKLINDIMSALRLAAESRMNSFPAGVTFFQLAFLSDKELLKIAKLAGV